MKTYALGFVVLQATLCPAASFALERFYAGGFGSTDENYVIFGIRPTPGASFANCTHSSETGPIVPEVPRSYCQDAPAVTWSLARVGDGDGMLLQAWWAFTSRAALYGRRVIPEKQIVRETEAGGRIVESYEGPHEFLMETVTVAGPGLV
ncbi:hypothetical protein HYQ45_004696 [Verticillium longisporum]|uniref:Uncharacterized protein n=1 Tax=Verticillium longisporum TaxID=100787 RepID=A0A0G4LGV6_VERLO|nr:hypothetical protein HYQ44_011518 [Verticillium longisporum]KAG7138167.1 hypothetical protein HYQ45_004696 [Verticillium longisporum]CRK21159.1 hypothetical protein BN1723_012264 [Verticillium longisporum]